MSYLLDALRKSEHERRIGQVPTLESQPVAKQPPRRGRWVIGFIVVLVIINIGMVLYVFIPQPDGSQRKGAPPDNVTDITTSPTAETVHRNAPAKPDPVIKSPEKSGQTAANAPKSISEMIAAKAQKKATAAQQQAKPAPRPKAPAAKAPARRITRGASAPANDSLTAPVKKKGLKPLATTEKTKGEEGPPPAIAARHSPPPPPAAGGVGRPSAPVPLLRKLPSDFRRRVPTMAINVFVYSDRLDERFVIINMAKYRTGDKIENGPVLEAIRPDSVVLRFEGKRFRLKRP